MVLLALLGFFLSLAPTAWTQFLDKVRLGDAWFSLKCRLPSFLLRSCLVHLPVCLLFLPSPVL